MIAGIDPGQTGAIAVIDDSFTDDSIFVKDTPTATIEGPRRKRTVIVETELLRILREAEEFAGKIRHCWIEQVHAMPVMGGRECPVCHRKPTQGVTSAFHFGYGYGLWIMALVALGIPYTEVHPATWKRMMLEGTSGKDKDASRLRAMQLYPASADLLTRKKDHGRADAMLIAGYGARSLQAKNWP